MNYEYIARIRGFVKTRDYPLRVESGRVVFVGPDAWKYAALCTIPLAKR